MGVRQGSRARTQGCLRAAWFYGTHAASAASQPATAPTRCSALTCFVDQKGAPSAASLAKLPHTLRDRMLLSPAYSASATEPWHTLTYTSGMIVMDCLRCADGFKTYGCCLQSSGAVNLRFVDA